MTFSANDTRALEAAFHKLADEEEHAEQGPQPSEDDSGDMSISQPYVESGMKKPHHKPSRSLGQLGTSEVPSPRVPVNEDYLFDVDVRQRELAPAYWLGPVYTVRRGTWFYVDGTNAKPCDENLAFQLEEGYVKTRPWSLSPAQRSASQTRKGNPTAEATITEGKESNDAQSRADSSVKDQAKESEKGSSQTQTTLPTHRLFGSHMNSVVAYQDDTTAWLLSDDFLSRMSSSVYQRFAGGAHRSGTRVMRGYQDLRKKTTKDAKRPATPTKDESRAEVVTGSPASSGRASKQPGQIAKDATTEEASEAPETYANSLEKRMSNLVSSGFQQDDKQQAEEARKREEKEIREDYRDNEGDDQGREVDHLVLVTHGIGQRLGARFEAFNFIHDVNEFRKTLKAVYNDSEDLRALNGQLDRLSNNCRVQVLPICWRHALDFPRHSLKQIRKEHDLGDIGAEEEDNYPSLEDITLEGVPALRNIVADLALDVLLYQTPAYNVHISKIVADECNRIMNLFKQRNPSFKGKISLIGHSLGSAVFFDLLSDQVGDPTAFNRSARRHTERKLKDCKLDFEVDNLVCLGSPIGLFQMLNGKTVSGRTNPNNVTLDGSHEEIEDPFTDSPYTTSASKVDAAGSDDLHGIDAITSSPKCNQLYNIFHPTDPIAYRLEPLVSASMTTLKPQALPYTKSSLFGAPMGQGITGIPARVGQSVSGFWSNFSSGLASNFIRGSMGLSAEDAAKLAAPSPVPHNRSASQPNIAQRSVGAGTNIIGGGVISPEEMQRRELSPVTSGGDDERKRKLALVAADAERDGTRPPTLIDSDIETLYSGFQKRPRTRSRASSADLRAMGDPGKSVLWAESETRARKLKREEAKVRLLNKNGRVDYSIQEGAFDISFLASIASHLAYWTDEDVAHFLISQLLSKQRPIRKTEV